MGGLECLEYSFEIWKAHGCKFSCTCNSTEMVQFTQYLKWEKVVDVKFLMEFNLKFWLNEVKHLEEKWTSSIS